MFIKKIQIILSQYKWVLIVILAVIALSIFVIGLTFQPSSNNTGDEKVTSSITPSSTPAPVNLEENYSDLNKIFPGKSTLNDVEKINGKPNLIKKTGDKTILIYKTPLEGFENKVLIKNNIVVYSVENVFGSYRGSVESFNSSYGAPDLSLFDKESNYSWYVYLKQGIAIENDGKDIGTILYFTPQSVDSFMKNVATEIGMVEVPSIEE